MDEDMVEPTGSVQVTTKRNSWLRELLFPLGAVVLGVLISVLFLRTYVVPSASMEETLKIGDYMFSVPLIDNANPPERGDIITFHPPASWGEANGDVFVKRVVAVGGDTVSCCGADGKLVVNGASVDEPYLNYDAPGTLEFNYTVPEGTVFVLGDNRPVSADSRYHPTDPFIPVENVIGQPFVVFWPLQDFRWL